MQLKYIWAYIYMYMFEKLEKTETGENSEKNLIIRWDITL